MNNLNLGTLFWDLRNIDSDKANKYFIEHKPSKLYKYRNVSENSINDFSDDRLWFNNPNNYNDPYDTYIGESLYRNSVEDIKEDILESNSNINKIFNKVETDDDSKLLIENIKKNNESRLNSIKKIRNAFKVSCFSKNMDSILMWSHYADSHRGFCLEYDFDILKKEIAQPFPVKYSNDIPNDENNKIKIMFTKSKDWSYEEEWRLVKTSKECKEKSFNIIPPIAIYLGSNMNEQDEELVINISKGKNIKIYKMQLNHNEFKLDAQLIWEQDCKVLNHVKS